MIICGVKQGGGTHVGTELLLKDVDEAGELREAGVGDDREERATALQHRPLSLPALCVDPVLIIPARLKEHVCFRCILRHTDPARDPADSADSHCLPHTDDSRYMHRDRERCFRLRARRLRLREHAHKAVPAPLQMHGPHVSAQHD